VTIETILIGCRVLVAEDHPVNQKLVAAVLKKLGCEAVFCENGQLAVEAFAQQRFDLVLMDIHMPVMDGLEASRQIRQKYPDPVQMPIIALSADVMNDAQERALAAGINKFLPKPVRLPELKAVMTQLVMQERGIPILLIDTQKA
jgi:two-component system, sensor histidine kinase